MGRPLQGSQDLRDGIGREVAKMAAELAIDAAKRSKAVVKKFVSEALNNPSFDPKLAAFVNALREAGTLDEKIAEWEVKCGSELFKSSFEDSKQFCLSEICRWLKDENISLLAPRNGPCPCGSGRKFKKCCRRLAAVNPVSGN